MKKKTEFVKAYLLIKVNEVPKKAKKSYFCTPKKIIH